LQIKTAGFSCSSSNVFFLFFHRIHDNEFECYELFHSIVKSIFMVTGPTSTQVSGGIR
jgi:hypothetical protein